MSNKLKKIYSSANKLDRYCDTKTPCKLYRGLKKGSAVGLMVPTIFGFYKRNEPRNPDVFISDSVSTSPQFKTDGVLVTESKSQPLTHEILKESDKYMVRGCRTMSGEYRGLSRFVTL